ncbi:MAG TPA: penicillin-binding transpeptidase domain-containing protein [Gaiellaceae bacterium]|nr:penicillin-binding transpeptidase domain-containing protein [Gaiellaceae bacterium]
MRVPRSLPDRSRVQPYSRADAPYFRSPGFYVRVGGLAILIGGAICILVLRAWSIQVLHGKQYTSQANLQSFRTVDIPAPRGAIVDLKGRLLAETRGKIVVVADVGALGALDQHGWAPTPVGYAAIRKLSRLAHVPVATIVTRIQRSVIRSPFAPAVVLPSPDNALTNYLDERGADFPGFKVTGQPARQYPQGGIGSEYLGLLGEVSQVELGMPRYAHARPGVIVGQSGVEATYDALLNPGFTRAKVRVDSLGRIAGPLERLGNLHSLPTLQLTIDARLQRAAIKAVQDGMALARQNGKHPTGGSAVVMDPRTGAIYALVSSPDYNQVRAASDQKYAASLYTDPSHPLLDRAIAGVYPTGSTFKPITAEAALSTGIITPTTPLLCSGSFNLGGFVFHNVEAGVFTTMSLPTALAQSCDTWFYRLADRIYAADPAKQAISIQQWAHKFGLGQQTGIDLIGESGGLVPTPAWLNSTQHQPWTEGQTINLAIGQGMLQASPLQVAVVYAALANGGTIVTPHVARAVIRGSATRLLHFKPARKLKLTDVWAIRQGLYDAAHTPGGTSASVFANFPIPVAGKTGTAEAPPYDDHSWYASWAPFGHPKVVVVVMIEHGGFGADAAAPAAKEIYQAFFHVK